MTPKEKAIDLYEDYWAVYYAELAEDFTYKYITEISKKCALICVDEILDNNDKCLSRYKTNNDRVCIRVFWQEVKQEIEKL